MKAVFRQLLVKVASPEVKVPSSVEARYLGNLVHWRPSCRRLPEASVPQPLFPFFVNTLAPASKTALRHAKKLCRFLAT